MNYDMECSICKRGPCKAYKHDCRLTMPLGFLAANKNPQGLVRAMWAVGFRFDQKSDSFVVK